MNKIVIGGGCFWGVQEYYRRLKGVYETRVGYAQGHVENPSYEMVKSQESGHIEVCEITYDPNEIALLKIVEHLFRFIDPFQKDAQAEDVGTQYQTGIFVNDAVELESVKNYVSTLQSKMDQEITTRVELLDVFYEAEEYHQKYLVKNPTGYCHVDFSHIKKEEMK